MISLRGKCLLANPSLRDPNFAQSVVLMVRHDDDGAVGVILNKPHESGVTVADALGESVEAAESIRSLLHHGGPCQGPMMVVTSLHCPQSDEVMPGIYFTSAREDIESIMSKAHEPTRYIIGYAGWAAEQLEGELAEGSWEIVSASADEVFSEPAGLWQRLMDRATLLKYMRPEDIPKNPELN